MDAAKRRAFIKQQAVKKKQEAGQQAKGTGSSAPSKRKQPEKMDHQPKKQKTTPEPVVLLKAETKRTVTPMGHGKGKGLMKGPAPTGEKPPVLLREDSEYALEKLSSIITADDFEDLGNHDVEAMGETGLFTIAQAMLMMKGLIGRCLNHETNLDRLRKKNKMMEDELHDLKTWKINMETKLNCSEQVRVELKRQTEKLTQILKDKEKEVTDARNQLRDAKEEAIREYRDSDLLLAELGSSFADGFDDALHQVKASYPDLDVSHVLIDA